MGALQNPRELLSIGLSQRRPYLWGLGAIPLRALSSIRPKTEGNTKMRISQGLITRHKMVAIATLATAAFLVGPMTSAAALAPHQYSAQSVAHLARTKLVPNVVGNTAYVAKSALKKVGFGYAYSTPKGSFVVLSADWTVTKQSPRANSRARVGTKVKLSVVKTSTLTKPSSAPAAPPLSVSQEQALIAARGYLADGQGFSYQGLIDQLSSTYGNGFSVPDATAAVNLLNADWNAQAVIAARGYLESGEGFSHESLVDQLSSPYGNQFTAAQAEYAVTQVGL
jgi:hypothetical protein